MRLSPLVIALIVIAALLVGGVAYFFFVPGAQNMFRGTEVIEDPETVNEMILGFVGAPFTNDYGVTRVPGWLDNNSESEIRAVTIQIQLLDEDGNKKETIDFEVEDVAPNSRKTFDINGGTIQGSRTGTIEIKKVEVYK